MLCLSRRVGESLILNGNITVTVLAINGNTIRLGCNAPREVPIHRKEIQDAISKNKKPA